MPRTTLGENTLRLKEYFRSAHPEKKGWKSVLGVQIYGMGIKTTVVDEGEDFNVARRRLARGVLAIVQKASKRNILLGFYHPL